MVSPAITRGVTEQWLCNSLQLDRPRNFLPVLLLPCPILATKNSFMPLISFLLPPGDLGVVQQPAYSVEQLLCCPTLNNHFLLTALYNASSMASLRQLSYRAIPSDISIDLTQQWISMHSSSYLLCNNW